MQRFVNRTNSGSLADHSFRNLFTSGLQRSMQPCLPSAPTLILDSANFSDETWKTLY